MLKESVIIRKAKISDAVPIQKLIQQYAESDVMLMRPLMQIYEEIRDYFVALKGKTVIGCCALHVCWKDLAEIKALAVKPKFKGKGIGRMLVEANLQEAVNIKIKKVFCLTYIPRFFRKFGFRKIDKKYLPHKIWNECINCPKFPKCDEVSMIKTFR
ncbi:MAG: N-acetyltransferase [Candidatus Omnitrophota bacterium]